MKEAATLAAAPRSNPLQAWNRFWFQPANPTTLGLMRICAGLLTLYIHLAYSIDLFGFFGKDAWLSLARANQNRAEAPWFLPPAGWYGSPSSLYIPDDLVVRNNLFNWLEQLPEDKASRLNVARQLHSNWLKDLPKEQANQADRLREIVQFLGRWDDRDRVNIPGYIAVFYAQLPDGPPVGEEASPQDVPPFLTKWQLINFIKNLPDDKAARIAKLEYMREWAADPDQVENKGGIYWSVWYHVTDPAWMVVTHVAILLVMFMFAIGFCTRVTSVLTWLAALSYIQRSPVTLFGVDTMMNICLFYLMIGPSGAALSVDRLLARWWAVRKARRAGQPVPEWAPSAPLVSANFALRLFQLHFCWIYLMSGTSKLLGGNWWNGTAVYYTMANYEFAPLGREAYLAFMHWLAEHRWLWEFVIAGGTYSTLALEIGLPFLVWNRRLRPYVVAASMTLHTFIAITMGLVAFSLLMATMVMSFIPGETVQRSLAWLRDRYRKDRDKKDARPAKPAESALAAVEVGTEPAVLEPVSEVESAMPNDKDRGKRRKEKSVQEK
jgi:hypothetical protein